MRMNPGFLAVVVVGLALQACGGGSSSGADPSKFIGTWKPTSGTETDVCPSSSGTTTSSITDNETWAKGISSDLVQTASGTNCTLNADIKGMSAQLASTPPCTITGNAGSGTITITAYTFQLTADGLATESGSGTATIVSAGASETCTIQISASYMKITG